MYYDSGYTPLWNAEIVADLVELLMLPDVQWYEVEELLFNSPGETRFLRVLRANRTDKPTFLGKSPTVDFVIDEEARQILLHSVFPYATLLDTRLTPLEQGMQLHREGIDVIKFCDSLQAWPVRWPELPEARRRDVYRDACHLITRAWIDHYSLLRGAERRPEPTEQLLRAAAEAEMPSEELLKSSASPANAAPRTMPSRWWQRLMPGKPAVPALQAAMQQPSTQPTTGHQATQQVTKQTTKQLSEEDSSCL